MTGEVFSPFMRRKEELTIQSGVVMWGYRVIIPSSLQKTMLTNVHASHLGIVKCKDLAALAYVKEYIFTTS